MAEWINIRAHLEKNIYLLASDDIGYLSVHPVITRLLGASAVSPMRTEIKSTHSVNFLLIKCMCQTLLGPGARK